MTEELCALVAECQSAAASANSGSEEADAEVHVKSEICSDGEHDVDTSAEVRVKSEICSDGEHDADTELIEEECNAQLMSQPFVALRDVFQHGGRHNATSLVAGPPTQLLLPLEAHLEDEPEVDDLFPQVHEDRARKVDRVGKKVTRKRAVSVVSLPPSIVRSDASVERPSGRKQRAKSETLSRPHLQVCVMMTCLCWFCVASGRNIEAHHPQVVLGNERTFLLNAKMTFLCLCCMRSGPAKRQQQNGLQL